MLTGSEADTVPFWRTKTLAEMTSAEWEALCDGCGRCCMLKLEDEDTDEIYMTRIACRLLDIGKCCCQDYPKRHDKVPDCLQLTVELVESLSWLPETCAYRLVQEGQDLAWWHPLVSGDPESVHQAGISVRTWAMTETPTRAEQLHKYLIIEED
ncbi:MAG: YcgN family cysteine cluster protein [Pseudomonadota bacterium]